MSSDRSLIIIDDEASLLQILKDYLEDCGLKVTTYEVVPDLENELREIGPHAVLLDILMPRVSGIAILKKIKSIDPKLPVIMMTGFADDTRRLESLRNGAYALLTKPFTNLEELYHTISNAMNHYIETIRTQELSLEIQERYKHEKMNLLELDFLKNLQHMIGETEDPENVLNHASVLLKNFLEFDYFSTLIVQRDNTHIKVFPEPERNPDMLQSITSSLLNRLSHVAKGKTGDVAVRGNPADIHIVQDGTIGHAISELSTAKKVYGFAGIFRKKPFENQEELIFNRFCSHIAVILEKISLFNEIKMFSIHDGLTGVFNHMYSLDMMDAEVARAKRYGILFSVILADIDNFKEVNDTYGHLAGDFVLKGIARLFERELRVIDVIGRYGGEEFIVILPQTDITAATNAAERLRFATETEHFFYEGKIIRITISLGVASYRDERDAQVLIKIADDNLYKAKKRGKNRVCYEEQS